MHMYTQRNNVSLSVENEKKLIINSKKFRQTKMLKPIVYILEQQRAKMTSEKSMYTHDAWQKSLLHTQREAARRGSHQDLIGVTWKGEHEKRMSKKMIGIFTNNG